MATVVVTLKIMPESVEVNLKDIQQEAESLIQKFAGKSEMRIEQQPIAFGLKALQIMFVMDESKGNLDPLEDLLRNIEGVQSVEVTDVRRTVG